MKPQTERRQTQLNFKFNPIVHAQSFVMPSQTVPDDSYTIKDILTRFTRGIDPMLTRLGEYDGELNSSIEEEEFTVNPIRQIEDLTDIQELESFLEKANEKRAYLTKKLEEERIKKQLEIQPLSNNTVK